MSFLEMDSRTVVLLASAIALLLAQAMLLLTASLKKYSGPGYWAAGTCGLALTTILISQQGRWHPLLSVVAGNTGTVAALGLICHGLATFLGHPPRVKVYLAACLFTLAGFLYFTVVEPSYPGRAVVFSLAYAMLMGHSALTLWRSQADRREPVFLFALAAFAIPVVLGAGRIVVVLSRLSTQQELLQASPLGALTLLLLVINHVALTLGLIMLATSRFAREVEEGRAQLACANLALERLSTQDGLTQIANRRHLDQHLELELRRARREQTPLSLLLLDIDHFKSYNDAYGHQAGDACLRQVAMVLSRAARRPGDLAARYGGEEFALVLPGTDLSGALTVAEEIRRQVMSLNIERLAEGGRELVTVSLGAASLDEQVREPEDLVARADKALYQAKSNGRNQVWGNGASSSSVREAG